MNKVLYLVPDLFGPPGGIARYCRMVCQALACMDATMTVMALHDHGDEISSLGGMPASMMYHWFGGSRTTFVRKAMAEGIRSRPSLILIGHPHFSLVGWALSRLVRAPFVVFMYGIEVWEPLTFIRRWALQRADLVVAISQFTAQKAIVANLIPQDRIRLLNNCLDPEFEDVLATDNRKLSILTVSRMNWADTYKGHEYVIRAMPQLLTQFPDLVYEIVGDGTARSSLEQLAVQLGVQRAVHFHGIIPEKELRYHYATASIFVMPSRKEGFGFVFLEAMACGMPVIGGNQDATPEVIVDGITGFVVDPTAVDAIIEAISRLLGDEMLRTRMGKAAQRHAHDNFNFLSFTNQLRGYLSEVVKLRQDFPTRNSS